MRVVHTYIIVALVFGLESMSVVPAAGAQGAAVVRTDSLSAAQWREDLRFMAERMEERHMKLYHTITPEAFAAAVADLHSRIPSLQRNEIIVGMMRIAAMVGDAHTNVSPLKDARFGFRELPLKLYPFDDGLYVRATVPAHRALLGARVEAIGGVPVEEAVRRVREISPRDNEYTARFYAPIFLGMPAILHALGLSPHADSAVLTLTRGAERWTARIAGGEVAPLWPPDTDVSLVTPEGWVDARTGPQPLWLQAPLDYHRLVPLARDSALYVQLNMVTWIAGQSLDQFAERILEQARTQNPRALVLDLRLNRGGNGDLRYGLVRALVKAEDEDTRLYVLTWRGAFSATQFILDDLDRYTGAVFVGEPAASKANSFGDSYRDVLPNSGLTVRSSIRWHQVGDDRRPWTPIDIAAPYQFADYVAGRDPALAVALRRAEPLFLADLVEAAAGEGAGAVVRAAERYFADPGARFQDQLRATFVAADRLIRGGHREHSVALMEAATRRFPDAADAWVVLSQLAEYTERWALARRAAERTLELDPDHRTGRAVLERVRGKAEGVGAGTPQP